MQKAGFLIARLKLSQIDLQEGSIQGYESASGEENIQSSLKEQHMADKVCRQIEILFYNTEFVS